MYRNYFKEVWDLHLQWAKGVLYKDILQKTTSKLVISEIGGEFYNFAFPTINNPSEFDQKEVEEILTEKNEKPVIVLLEEHQKVGFTEHLIRGGYTFWARDTWMGYDEETYKNTEVKSEVVKITPDQFPDYNAVLGKVFVDWPGNDTYNEICRKTITGEIKGDFPGLQSELYVIYDNGKPAAGAGMFYSKEGNFAYLHDAGTLEEYRGKGYQTDLIRHRTNIALEKGIDRIYSSVEHGEQSWSNMIKTDFNDMHTSLFLVKKQ